MRALTLLAIFSLVGCASGGDEAANGGGNNAIDDDGDGLSVTEESDLGTSDGDLDSDGDGYQDAWEVTEGSDPADGTSLIYDGGWPYNPGKDAMADPGWDGKARVGKAMPRFAWVDQNEQEVDIYDFAGQGKPVVIDVSGVWCYKCNELASLIEGEASELSGYGWDNLGSVIDTGKVLYITVLDAGNGSAATEIDQKAVNKWVKAYPNPNIAVLQDVDQELIAWLKGAGYPTLFMLDENLEITVYDKADYTAVLTAMMALNDEG